MNGISMVAEIKAKNPDVAISALTFYSGREYLLPASEMGIDHYLLMANVRLERRVGECTSNLQASVKERESFSYSVSHDLRTPLRHMNSFSPILIEEYARDLSAPVNDYLGRTCSASSKMGALIDQLL
jgi:DNA-binding NarL/FixJ family response regulator